jgi:hypothetical protein
MSTQQDDSSQEKISLLTLGKNETHADILSDAKHFILC